MLVGGGVWFQRRGASPFVVNYTSSLFTAQYTRNTFVAQKNHVGKTGENNRGRGREKSVFAARLWVLTFLFHTPQGCEKKV